MRKIVDYHVLNSNCVDNLQDGVKTWIELGWEPIGGMSVETNGLSASEYYQAMVKYEETDKTS